MADDISGLTLEQLRAQQDQINQAIAARALEVAQARRAVSKTRWTNLQTTLQTDGLVDLLAPEHGTLTDCSDENLDVGAPARRCQRCLLLGVKQNQTTPEDIANLDAEFFFGVRLRPT